jgi:hypothetical protein
LPVCIPHNESLLSKDGARRIAANIAKLPWLSRFEFQFCDSTTTSATQELRVEEPANKGTDNTQRNV